MMAKVLRKQRGTPGPETLPVSALVSMGAPWNPRTIDPDEMEALKRSLKFFGAVQPIVVNTRSQRIVGGHQRVVAAQALEMQELPVVYVDLDDPSEKQLNLALNRISGAWDEAKLAEVIRDLQQAGADMALTGFTDDEIREYLGQIAPETIEEAEPGPPPEDPITKKGDLILMGDHRLLCGDSRVAADTERLMDGNKGSCMWTDPPYGVDYVGGTKDAKTIQNDSREGLAELLGEAFARAGEACVSGAPFYIARPGGGNSLVFTAAVNIAGWTLRQELQWVKDSMVLGRSDYHYQHETIMYGFMAGGQGRLGRGGDGWYGDNSQKTVFNFPKPNRSELHPTMKPVGLVAAQLTNSTKTGDLVYDPFSGAGSTLMACEQLGRTAYGLEIDPAYCDVIVQRWEAFTGGKAKRG